MDVKFCMYCGSKLFEGDRFCTYCGQEIVQEIAIQEPETLSVKNKRGWKKIVIGVLSVVFLVALVGVSLVCLPGEICGTWKCASVDDIVPDQDDEQFYITFRAGGTGSIHREIASGTDDLRFVYTYTEENRRLKIHFEGEYETVFGRDDGKLTIEEGEEVWHTIDCKVKGMRMTWNLTEDENQTIVWKQCLFR